MLENKVALVTGASRGIGRAIALTLAAQGAAVAVNYNGSRERAQEVVDSIKSRGGQASLYQCSVGDFQACQEMIQNVIKEYGHLDILVNNAGITRDSLIMKMKEEDFDAVIETNLKGAFNTIRHVSRQMLSREAARSSTFHLYPEFWEMQDRPIMRPAKPASSDLQRPWPESWRAEGSQSML